jgi:hypothetical protein
MWRTRTRSPVRQAAACFLRRLRNLQLALDQRFDCGSRRFADHAVRGRFIAGIQQTDTLRGLAQQLRAGTLA